MNIGQLETLFKRSKKMLFHFGNNSTLREVIQRKKAAYLWTMSKRGGGEGQIRIQKNWGSIFGAFFWTLRRKGGGVNLKKKIWGSFQVFLR